jgi:hypothetical protein
VRPNASDLRKPSERRWRPVRLVDVPVDVRLEAAKEAAASTEDAEMKQRIFEAALFPSSQTYWIAA